MMYSFYLVVETGRAPSQHRQIVFYLIYHFAGMRRGTPRLYNWIWSYLYKFTSDANNVFGLLWNALKFSADKCPG